MPNLCPDALKWLLSNTAGAAIFDIVRKNEFLWPVLTHGGFQLNANSFDRLNQRLRLVSILQRNQEILNDFLQELQNQRSWQPARQAVQMLRPDWLKKNWRKFFRTVADPRPLVLALSWEESDVWIVRLCQLLFCCPSFWQDSPQSRADSMTAAGLNLLSGAGGSAAMVKSESPKQASLLQNCQQENAGLRKQIEVVRKEYKLLQQEKDRIQSEFQQQLDTFQRNFAAREQDWRQQAGQIQATAREQARREIEDFQLRTLGLHPDLELQIATIRNENFTLQQRIAKALQHQENTNRKYGLLQDLRKEIANLEDSLQKIQLAIDEAVHVSEDLPGLQKEVEEKLQELYDRLRENKTGSGMEFLPGRFHNLIKSIPLDGNSPRKFIEIRELLEQDLIQKLFLPAELASLIELLEKRRNLQNNQITSQETRQNLHHHTRFILAWAPHVADFPRISLYIDGCNLLLSDPEWQAATRKQGQAAARTDILNKCKRKAKLFKAMQLVFDGTGSQNTVETLEAGLTLHFAARLQADQNADNYLVRLLQDTPKSADELRWIVTDDAGLQKRVETLCEAIVPTSTFAHLLHMI